MRTTSRVFQLEPRMNLTLFRRQPFFLLALLGTSLLHAQSGAQSGPLFKTIQALDSKLFDAYNHCDLATLGAMVSDDLEFYHDQTGLSVGKEPFLPAIRENICGKVERFLV